MDVKISTDHDMHTDKGRNILMNKIKDFEAQFGWKPYVHFAPPCSTYSQARYPKIRSKSHPAGLHARQLPFHSRKALKHANKTTQNPRHMMTDLSNTGTHTRT